MPSVAREFGIVTNSIANATFHSIPSSYDDAIPNAPNFSVDEPHSSWTNSGVKVNSSHSTYFSANPLDLLCHRLQDVSSLRIAGLESILHKLARRIEPPSVGCIEVETLKYGYSSSTISTDSKDTSPDQYSSQICCKCW